jgi:hypothetical protein
VIPPAGSCVWGCESNAPFNREHIIGKQFAKALGMPFPIRVGWGDLHRPTGLMGEHGTTTENELGIVLDDRVCKRCNENWMKKLDDRTMKFMWPALHHRGQVGINRKQQLDLARWATKVGLLLALYFHDQPKDPRSQRKQRNYVPADNFTELFRNSAGLPRHTHVWFGAVAPTEVISECFVSTEGIRDASGPVGYYTTIRLRRLVFFVTGLSIAYEHPVDDWIDAERIVDKPKTMTPIWPAREPIIEWPPPRHLYARELARLIQVTPNRG